MNCPDSDVESGQFKKTEPHIDKIRLDHIDYMGRSLKLSEPIVLDVSKESHGYQVTSEELLMWGNGSTVNEAVRDFSSLAFDYVDLVKQYGRGSNQYWDALMSHIERQ